MAVNDPLNEWALLYALRKNADVGQKKETVDSNRMTREKETGGEGGKKYTA